MKKKQLWGYYLNFPPLPLKLLRVMKLSVLLTCILSVNLMASVYSQKARFDLDIKDQSVRDVLKTIEKGSEFRFFYNDEFSDLDKKLTFSVTDKSIDDLLSVVLDNAEVGYKVLENNFIVITPKSLLQQRQVTGKVTDETGSPLPGVTVVVTGSSIGAITDASGIFNIPVPSNATSLKISFVGMKPIEVQLGNRTEINVTMVPDVMALGEVVVTALGISRESKSLVYAVQNVKSVQLTEVRDPNNVLNSFQGKVANALITQSTGGLGSDAQIILRGNRSIQNTNSALIVVDGVPTSAPNINPDDIESVTILPGATGGALYGGEAGNGVIVITTKKGKLGDYLVTLNSGAVFESPFALPRVQNIYGQGISGNLDPGIGDSWGAKMTGQSYTNYLGNTSSYSAQPNNIKDFFNRGFSFNNALSVSGGTEKMQTYLSYTNNNVAGIVPNNTLKSNSVNLRISNQISKKFSTDAKFTYLRRDIEYRPNPGEGNRPVLDIYQIPRNVSTADAEQYQIINNLGVPERTPWPSTVQGVYANPYWVVNKDINNITRDNIIGFLRLKYQITDGLSLTGSANLDRSLDNAQEKIYQGTLQLATKPGGYYDQTNSIYSQKWFDAIFEGNHKITEKLKVNYHAGFIFKDNSFDETHDIADGLNIANKFSLNFATTPQYSSTGTEVQTQSVFGQASFSYKDAIYLDGSLRNDWDSRLPAPHAFQYYSFGAATILSELIALPENLTFLKANINYAEVGNGGQFGLLSASYDYSPGAGNGYLSRGTVLPFPDLKPEIVKNLEASIDARLWNNRYGFTVTYYKSNSINQLLTISMPVATGYARRYINAGNIQNQGLELIINANPLSRTDFNWDIAFNIGINRNKIINLSDAVKIVYLGSFIDFGGLPQVKEGGSFGDITAYQWKKDASGNYLVTSNGKPLTTKVAGDQPGVIGNFNPKATLGLTNTFTYKNISLRILIDGRIGGVMISGTEQNLAFSGITEGTLKYREGGWNLGGTDINGEQVGATISSQDFWQTVSQKRAGVGEFFAYDITNFRVRDLSLGYMLPFHSSFIKSAKLSAVAHNLFWVYRGSSTLSLPGEGKRKMWFDPDMSFGGNNLKGVEYGVLPSTRSVGINLNLTF
jgi:TonB-linked SusC/RagA family outer membrane protein